KKRFVASFPSCWNETADSVTASSWFSPSPCGRGFGDWTFCDFTAKGGSDRHSCLSNSSLKQLKTGKNACLYLNVQSPVPLLVGEGDAKRRVRVRVVLWSENIQTPARL